MKPADDGVAGGAGVGGMITMPAASDQMPALPDDAEALRALLLAAWAERDSGAAERDSLAAERDALRHWDGLEQFLKEGRIDIDTNSVGRAMRPVALSRKNSLFAGRDEGGANWAHVASLVETCKLNAVNPQTYFTDLLTRLVNDWPQARIDELMPRHWTPAKDAAAQAA